MKTKRGGRLPRIVRFYLEGFKEMTIGKTLWLIILIKLFVLFAILRVFFFQPVLSGMNENEKENHVANELIEKKSNNQ